MLANLTTVFTQVLSWLSSFVSALFTTGGSLATLQPLFFIGIAVSLVMVAVKLVRKIVWGN